MTVRFGTDGVRQACGRTHPEIATAIGRAAVRAFGGPARQSARPRRSGPLLEAAPGRRGVRRGCRCGSGGVVPTPGGGVRRRARRCGRGWVISASHNAFADNGIAVRPGEWPAGTDDQRTRRRGGDRRGARRSGDRRNPYEGVPVGTTSAPCSRTSPRPTSTRRRSKASPRVVGSTGCGWSSTARTAPRRPSPRRASRTWAPGDRPVRRARRHQHQRRLGSTHPEVLQAACSGRRPLGLAFDGDADRLLAVDEQAAWSTATSRWRCAPPTAHRAAHRRHRRGDRHVQPGLPSGDGTRGITGDRDRRWVIATCWRPWPRATSAWGRAVGPPGCSAT